MKLALRNGTGLSLNSRQLRMISLVCFFAQDAIRVLVSTLCPFFSYNATVWIVIAIMYVPLIVSIMIQPKRSGQFVGRFLVCLGLVASIFAITYIVHPEYEYWFFEGSYPIWDRIFRPNQYLYVVLFLGAVGNPKEIMRAMKTVAYILLAYYTYRFLVAQMRGYWITTTTASGAKHAAYDLNFGYDHLLVLTIFMVSGFREKKKRYFILAAVSLLQILMGGSRGPLIGVAVLMIVMYIHYRQQLNIYLRLLIILAIVVLVLMWVLMGIEGIVVFLGTFLSKTLGISSRTIETMVNSSFMEGSGRDRLYGIAIDMIKDGFWGYGAYGDRYVVGRTFWVGYAHNIFLELIIDFGWIFGGFLCLKSIINSVRMLFFCNNHDWRDMYVLFFIPCIKLLLSGSFWYSEAFFACVLVYANYKKQLKNWRKSSWAIKETTAK